MKKLITILFGLILLTSCSDAYTKVSNSNEELLKIGNKTITKGDLYSSLLSNYGGFYTINDASSVILDKEIEISDEMKKNADEQLAQIKSMYGNDISNTLKMYGYSSEDDFYMTIINNSRADELVKKYIDENFDSLVKEYNPRKATILSFADKDTADKAKADLDNGIKSEEVATTYSSATSGISEIVTKNSTVEQSILAFINTSEKTDSYTILPSTVSESVYLVKVDETDVNAMKDEIITNLATVDELITNSDSYYFKKYKFKVYDKVLFDILNENYSNYLNQ